MDYFTIPVLLTHDKLTFVINLIWGATLGYWGPHMIFKEIILFSNVV